MNKINFQVNYIYVLIILCYIPSIYTNFIDINENREYIDSFNRTIIYHGVNAVYKLPPYIPQNDTFDPYLSITDKDIDNLVDWGFNVVRLGVMWEAVEPYEGVYNDTYMLEIKHLINKLGEKDIKVIIDSHQDTCCNMYCGQGIPNWFANKSLSKIHLPFPMPITIKPYQNNTGPLSDECTSNLFWNYYLTDAVGTAFEYFYNNPKSFAEYWKYVANYFSDNENVMAYEILNEPWPGRYLLNPRFLISSGYADRNILASFYEYVTSEIRTVDTEHLIMFEPVTWDYLKSGFEKGPDTKYSKDIFAYHIYCPIDRTTHFRNMTCINYLDLFFKNREEDANRMNIGAFVTEFGATGNETFDIDRNIDVTNRFDLYKRSWAYWEWKDFKDITGSPEKEGLYNKLDGSLELNKLLTLSKPYPMKVSGNLISFNWNHYLKDFEMEYIPNTNIKEPTEIYVNKLQFNKGHIFDVNNNVTIRKKELGDIGILYSIYVIEDMLNKAENKITIRIAEKR